MLTDSSSCKGRLYQQWCHFWEVMLKIETLPELLNVSSPSHLLKYVMYEFSGHLKESEISFISFSSGSLETIQFYVMQRTLQFGLGSSLPAQTGCLFGICSTVLDFSFLLHISCFGFLWWAIIIPKLFQEQALFKYFLLLNVVYLVQLGLHYIKLCWQINY